MAHRLARLTITVRYYQSFFSITHVSIHNALSDGCNHIILYLIGMIEHSHTYLFLTNKSLASLNLFKLRFFFLV